MPSVLTMGTFDLLHPGHVHLFRNCQKLANSGTVTVAVNDSDFIAKFKGRAPVQSLQERMTMVSAIRYVTDISVNYGGPEQPVLIHQVDPDLIVIGDDWQDRDYLGQLNIDQAFLDRRGIEVVYVPRIGGLSSTELKGRVRS